MYTDGSKCTSCGKTIDDLLEHNLDPCATCNREIMQDIASRTVAGHFLDVWVCIFHFQFLCAIGSLIWSIARLFKIGDYNPKDGMFAEGIYRPERDPTL